MLSTAAIRVRQVVDVGCGAGPLTAALVQAGFDVTGIDSSAKLVEIARATVPGARFIYTSVYDAEIPPCEAIVAMGEPLTYHAAVADADSLVKGFFERASDVLPPGGMLIFDTIELGEPSLAGRFWSTGDDWVTPKKIRIRKCWSGTSIPFGGLASCIGVDARSTEYDFSTPARFAINLLHAGSRWKRQQRTAHSGLAHDVEPFFALATESRKRRSRLF
jgi:SAM-dependent methyltransferase